MSGVCISSNISFYPTCENEKSNLCNFLNTSPMVSTLGWSLYLTMAYKYVVCNWIIVSVFGKSKISYYIGKESIQNISGIWFNGDYFTIISQGDSFSWHNFIWKHRTIKQTGTRKAIGFKSLWLNCSNITQVI